VPVEHFLVICSTGSGDIDTSKVVEGWCWRLYWWQIRLVSRIVILASNEQLCILHCEMDKPLCILVELSLGELFALK